MAIEYVIDGTSCTCLSPVDKVGLSRGFIVAIVISSVSGTVIIVSIVTKVWNERKHYRALT